MQNKNKGRLKTIDNEESIVFSFSGLQFVNVATIPFVVMTVLLLLVLSLIFYGLYYAPIAYKPVIAIFSLPFIGVEAMVVFISLWLLTRKSLLEVSIEQIKVESQQFLSLKKNTRTKITILKQKDIIGIKNIQFSMPTNYQPKTMHPEVVIVTEEKEYSISRLTGYIPTNSEANWMTEKICNYLKKDIVD